MKENKSAGEGFRLCTEIQPRFSDIDAFGMVNNARVVTYFEEGRVHYLKNLNIFIPPASPVSIVIRKVEVEYLAPILHSNLVELYLRTTAWGESSFCFEYELRLSGQDVLAAKGSTLAVSFDLTTRKPARIPDEFLRKMKEFEGAR